MDEREKQIQRFLELRKRIFDDTYYDYESIPDQYKYNEVIGGYLNLADLSDQNKFVLVIMCGSRTYSGTSYELLEKAFGWDEEKVNQFANNEEYIQRTSISLHLPWFFCMDLDILQEVEDLYYEYINDK